MGIDLEADSRAAADGEASAFERGIGRRWIEALELGNEPNLYGTFTWYVLPDGVHVTGRPPGYDFSSLPRRLRARSRTGLPGPLAGPATGSLTWMADTGAFLAAEPRVRVVTLPPVSAPDVLRPAVLAAVPHGRATCSPPPRRPASPTASPVRRARPRPSPPAAHRRDEHRLVRRRTRRQQRVRLGAVGARCAVRDGPASAWTA